MSVLRRRHAHPAAVEADQSPTDPRLAFGDEVLRKLVGISLEAGSGDFDEATERAIEAVVAAHHDSRDAIARAAFGALGEPQQLQVLTKIFDDEELRGALAAQHERALQRLRRTEAARALAELATETGYVDMSAIAPRTPIEIGLFAPTQRHRESPLTAESPYDLSEARTIRGLTEQEGVVHVTGDVINMRTYIPTFGRQATEAALETGITDHSLVEVGSMIVGPSGAVFTPELYRDTHVTLRRGEELQDTRLEVGFVLLGSGQDRVSLFGN